MVDRDERREQAAKHLSLVKGTFASETEESISAATIYEDGFARDLELPDPVSDHIETSVASAYAPTALANAVGKTAIVDPGSFLRPGGNYEDGAFGPEQVICSQSNLYPILRGLRQSYYQANRGYQRGQLFTDRAIYIPDVAFLHDGDIRKANVIVVAEPNLTRALENYRSERECQRCLEGRIDTFMRIAAVNECETLICGAFACGRQGFDPSEVIDVFKRWIDEHPGSLGHIIFAVPRVFVDSFSEAFGRKTPDVGRLAARRRNADGNDDGDNDDFRGIDLPEGITLR